MNETTNPFTICPRCGHHNVLRAKYCAGCGLNLVSAGAVHTTHVTVRTRRRSRLWLVVGFIVLGVALVILALAFRARPSSRGRLPLQPEQKWQRTIIKQHPANSETRSHHER